MFIRLLILIPIFVLCIHADTIQLTDGRELEGVIMEENPDHYLALIEISETIREEQKIPRSQVASITITPEDEKAFEKIADHVPTPDLLEPDEYTSRIESIESFLTTHPESKYAEAAHKMLTTLEQEYTLIRAGGLKFDGRMISPNEVSKNRYALDAAIIGHEFEQLAQHSHPIIALRKWRELDSQYRASEAFKNQLPTAIALMQHLKSMIESDLESLDQRLEEREVNIARAPQRDRDRIVRAIAQREERYKQRLAKEKEERIVWLSLYSYAPGPMKTIHGRLERELNRFEKLDLTELPDGDAAWRDVWKAIKNDPNSEEAKSAFRTFRSLRPPVKYIKLLESLLESN